MKQLERYLENHELTDYYNIELNFSVTMNLANAYEEN